MKNIIAVQDRAVVYRSYEDGCFVAHSLRTDQVGTGEDMGRALADLIRGVDQVLALAREDESIAYLRDAPKSIQDLAAKGKPLPKEVYEVAHKLARGAWPEDVEAAFSVRDDEDKTFIADLYEPVS